MRSVDTVQNERLAVALRRNRINLLQMFAICCIVQLHRLVACNRGQFVGKYAADSYELVRFCVYMSLCLLLSFAQVVP